MKKALKKILVWLLCFSILMSLFPVGALAGEIGVQATLKEGDYEYTVNSVGGGVTITRYSGAGIVIVPLELGGKKVLAIGDHAFAYCSITEIILPDELIGIGNSAFYNCGGLLKIIIPEKVKALGWCAFCECNNLKSIQFNSTTINLNANYQSFYRTIPQTTTIIGYDYSTAKDYATYNGNPFQLIENSTAIEGDYEYAIAEGGVTITRYKGAGGSITIPSTLGGLPVNKIGDEAFQDCAGLTSISLPEGLTHIGQEAFYNCKNLTNIGLSESLINIGDYAFSYCTSLTSISLPKSLTSISRADFWGCTSLTSISLPESLTNIGSYAFSNCISLTKISLPKKLAHIGDESFYECSSLTSISLPESLTSIGYWAFYKCGSLKSMRFNSEKTLIDESWGEIMPATTTLIGYEPSTAKDYAKKHGNPFQLIGSDQTTIEQNTKTVTVKALDKNGNKVAVQDANVYVYENGVIPMNIGKESDGNKIIAFGKTDANGNCMLVPPNGGWPDYAAVVACKNEEFTNDGRQKARALFDDYSDKDVVFTLQMHSLKISKDGLWYGKIINSINNNEELVMESPRYLCNLSIMYYYDNSSGDYYQDVANMVPELSKQLSQATDGYFAIDQVAIYNTTDETEFRKSGNIASECDIQIQSFSGIRSNASVGGYFNDSHWENQLSKMFFRTDKSITVHYRVQLSAINWNNKKVSDSSQYAKEVLHELGHYILIFKDEYQNADKKQWGSSAEVQHPLNNLMGIGKANYGLMDYQYNGIELSNRSKYSEASFQVTDQFREYSMDCWSSLVRYYSVGSNVNHLIFVDLFSSGSNLPESQANSLVDRYTSYINEPIQPVNGIGERLYALYSTSENIIDGRSQNGSFSTSSETAQASDELLATIKVTTEGEVDKVVVSPVIGTPVSLTQMFYDDTAPTDIPLTAEGDTFTGTIPVQKERYYLRQATIQENNETGYTDFVVRSTKDELESTYISDDQSFAATISTATADSYNFVSQENFVSRDGYVPLSKAVYITSKNKVVVSDSMILADASSTLVDTATIAWCKYENNEWSPLETQKQDGDYNSITAWCSVSGDGYYQLMAQPAKTTSTFQPVQALTVTPNNQYDGSASIEFTDTNNKENIRYYKFYYSNQPFSKDTLDSASAQIFNTYDSGYGYTFDDNTKTYYCAVQVVGKDGSVSDLCEIKSFTTGVRDTDSDGIPDSWVEQYSLDTTDNQDAAIAGLDNDVDGLNNQQEYQHNTNPQNKDTDDDGVTDSDELAKGLNPLSAMTDGTTSDYVIAYGANDFTVEQLQMSSENGTMNALAISLKNLKNTVAKDVNVKLLFDGNVEWFWQIDFEANKTTELSYVFDGDMPKTIQVSIDTEQLRSDVDYSNNTAQLSTTLESIAITTPATKLIYAIGEPLDLGGLAVTGTYTDGNTKTETITVENIAGFDSSKAAKDQILTLSVNGKTTTYQVQIVEKSVLGDADANGKIQAYDALMALQFASGKKQGTVIEIKAADVDMSGKVEAFDALQILQYAIGKITEL